MTTTTSDELGAELNTDFEQLRVDINWVKWIVVTNIAVTIAAAGIVVAILG